MPIDVILARIIMAGLALVILVATAHGLGWIDVPPAFRLKGNPWILFAGSALILLSAYQGGRMRKIRRRSDAP